VIFAGNVGATHKESNIKLRKRLSQND